MALVQDFRICKLGYAFFATNLEFSGQGARILTLTLGIKLSKQ